MSVKGAHLPHPLANCEVRRPTIELSLPECYTPQSRRPVNHQLIKKRGICTCQQILFCLACQPEKATRMWHWPRRIKEDFGDSVSYLRGCRCQVRANPLGKGGMSSSMRLQRLATMAYKCRAAGPTEVTWKSRRRTPRTCAAAAPPGRTLRIVAEVLALAQTQRRRCPKNERGRGGAARRMRKLTR